MEQRMIEVADALQQTERGAVDEPGGFAWWYADIVDNHGDGAVLIWSWGLPFLPGLLDAGRRGKAQRAAEWPSLNIAFYRGGERAYYLLQQFRPDECCWTEETDAEGRTEVWRFGETVIRRTLRSGRVELDAAFDCRQAELPALRGQFRLRGYAARDFAQGESERRDVHHWGVVSAQAEGSVVLETEGRRLALEGNGYHDRNWSRAQLDQIGVERWSWLRASDGERTAVLYRLRPELGGVDRCIGRWVEADGRVLPIAIEAVRWEGQHRDRYGMTVAASVTIESEGRCWKLRVAPPVERGPFYLRAAVADEAQGCRGFVECVAPSRIDRALERPLVRMAVHRRDGANSFWLPLFAGLKSSGAARLVRRRNHTADGP